MKSLPILMLIHVIALPVTSNALSISSVLSRRGVTFQVPSRPRLSTTPPGAIAALDQDEAEQCPKGYYLDSVHQSCNKLGPLGRMSQKVESAAPFQYASRAISNLFGVDTDRISRLGVAFALSYSIISNINGSITLSIAWFMSSKKTSLSPLAPGQWKSLLASYGTMYAFIQLLRPFRVAAAVAMSKLSKEFLEQTQDKFDCSRGVAIMFQYLLGLVAWVAVASVGIVLASTSSGVPIFSTR
mmetsp:Transcript_63020/g.186156  ORF Transcript_63020/g.186156 Transcript_63020/m.186156 type:complete len:242 (-) Transcript_63020:632-1357(-)